MIDLNPVPQNYYQTERAQLIQQSRPEWTDIWYQHQYAVEQHVPPHFLLIQVQAEDIRFLQELPSYEEAGIQKRFRELADKWYEEIGGDSSLTRINSNLNYLRIIKLGERVIPLIIEELEKEPAPWFLALQVLSERDDIGQDTPGDFSKITKAWLDWSKDATPAIQGG